AATPLLQETTPRSASHGTVGTLCLLAALPMALGIGLRMDGTEGVAGKVVCTIQGNQEEPRRCRRTRVLVCRVSGSRGLRPSPKAHAELNNANCKCKMEICTFQFALCKLQFRVPYDIFVGRNLHQDQISQRLTSNHAYHDRSTRRPRE